MNLGVLLSRHARYRPDHLAMACGDVRLSFREFNRRTNRLAQAFLGSGLVKGDKVAVILPNRMEMLDVIWACAKSGLVVVPLSPLLRGPGLQTLLDDSDAKLVVSDSGLAELLDSLRGKLEKIPERGWIGVDTGTRPGWMPFARFVAEASGAEPAVEVADEDPCNIIYSSGTTGLPKGIVHDHRIRSLYAAFFSGDFRIGPESVVAHAGSLVFNGAFLMMLAAMGKGASFVVQERFEAEAFIDLMAREGATHTMMVPSQIIALLQSRRFGPRELPRLQCLCAVGAPFHREHRERLMHVFPGVYHELYGLTEGFVTILDKFDAERKPESVGIPNPFCEIRIVDEQGADRAPREVGEIIGRSPLLMPGYYRQPELTAKAIRDGWLHSGDLGYVDEDGFLYLVDREKDMIITSGANVYPRDIEEVAVAHPLVREAAVFGIPDAKRGEVPLAAVILRERGSIDAESLRDWINARVAAAYQKVQRVEFMDDFPRNVAGKTLKRELRAPYWEGKPSRI